MKQFYVYIITNKENGTLYIGVTSNLQKRIWEHKDKLVEGFTKKYELDKLVHYEIFPDAGSAFERETQIKNWKGIWKLKLINQSNPKWEDLYEKII